MVTEQVGPDTARGAHKGGRSAEHRLRRGAPKGSRVEKTTGSLNDVSGAGTGRSGLFRACPDALIVVGIGSQQESSVDQSHPDILSDMDPARPHVKLADSRGTSSCLLLLAHFFV